MKVVHNRARQLHTAQEWMAKAKSHEQEGEWDEAIVAYEKVLDGHPLNERAYDRLMILHRKARGYRKELRVINAGIKAFTQKHEGAQKHSPNTQLVRLSKALSKATGLLDKTGKSLYAPEPIARWRKRKELVTKKLQ